MADVNASVVGKGLGGDLKLVTRGEGVTAATADVCRGLPPRVVGGSVCQASWAVAGPSVGKAM